MTALLFALKWLALDIAVIAPFACANLLRAKA